MEDILLPIIAYAENYSSKESTILSQIRHETESNISGAQMLSSSFQGRILSMLSCLIKPKSILEIGTYVGYSSICLAEGLIDDGVLHTIEKNEDLKNVIEANFKKAKIEEKVIFHCGDYKDIIPTLDIKFDLVFMDANKKGYSLCYDLVFDKVNEGGLIIVDNVWWKGRVIDKNFENDKITKAIKTFNDKLLVDKRIKTLFLPFRDGLLLVFKLFSKDI